MKGLTIVICQLHTRQKQIYRFDFFVYFVHIHILIDRMISRSSLDLLDLVLLEDTQECLLLGVSLEATMAHLGCGIDELEIDLLQCLSLGVHKQRLKNKQEQLSTGRKGCGLRKWSLQ